MLAVLLVGLLAGCGGGGGNGVVASCGTMLHPDACGSTTGTTAAAGAPVLGLALTSGTATVTEVSPGNSATLTATLTDSVGNPVPDAAVSFSTSDKTGTFVPSSGTALTSDQGIAAVQLPAGTQAGGYTVTASAAVKGVTVTGTLGYAVSFPTLTLGPLAVAPSTLSAGGNASVSVSVLSGSLPYLPSLAVTFTSPCIANGKATIGSPVLTQNGVATASYSDKGCGAPDIITATASIGDSNATQTGAINVLPAAVGSIGFVSASTTNIALQGTGGFGRQEFSTLTFKVFDKTGNPVSNSSVDFAFSDTGSAQTVGGLMLNPAVATSAADGSVTTLVTAGTIPTSARVVASIAGSQPLITTLSNVLVISTGVPDEAHFSLATATGNCEGRDIDQTCSFVTATLGDHFGNPVPDGTAVNFTTSGGVIDASCVTGSLPPAGATPSGQTTDSKVGPGSGTCTVTLRASSPRPSSGLVTVLAYAQGEETFIDSNGNNMFDATTLACNQAIGHPDGMPYCNDPGFLSSLSAGLLPPDVFYDLSPDIFRDDNQDAQWNPGEPCIGPVDPSGCSAPGDGQYNGVLRIPQLPSPQTLYVSADLVQIFSGSHATINFSPASLTCAAGGTADALMTVVDVPLTDAAGNLIAPGGNIMPFGTKIAFSAIFGASSATATPASYTVGNVVLGISAAAPHLLKPAGIYPVSIACPTTLGSGVLNVDVTTPSGTLSRGSASITVQ
ncbi:MAG: Ig-like domain-containing protein [Burkholderiales bacterium]|nr:Ig-like domain-containing protein [Burkholderiales bacterium]